MQKESAMNAIVPHIESFLFILINTSKKNPQMFFKEVNEHFTENCKGSQIQHQNL